MKPEKVLTVPTSCLWARIPYTERGLIVQNIEELTPVVASDGTFLDRELAETDPAHKQIIPYAVVSHLGSYFLLQRKSAQGERRLHNKFSIGVGGHINPSPGCAPTNLIQDGLTREVHEELHIAPGFRQRLVGLINDDTTEVGRVHLGVLFEIESSTPDVSVRETAKMEGGWALPGRVGESYQGLETWSQIVYDSYLCSRIPRGRTGTAG